MDSATESFQQQQQPLLCPPTDNKFILLHYFSMCMYDEKSMANSVNIVRTLRMCVKEKKENILNHSILFVFLSI